MPRYHCVLGDWVGGWRMLRQRNSSRHQGSRSSEACRCGERPELLLLALGFVFERRHQVVFTDEWGGGLGARCRPNDPNKWGADAIFNLKDDKLSMASYYKLPAAQGDTENCVAHNGSLVPVPGRDIEVQAWYQGGISVMDFTDAAHPFEIAYFDRGPIDPKMLVLGGDWSAYWYNGLIFGSEIARGLDIFELTPTKFLTQNEIDAAKTVQVPDLNVQNQQKIVWPSTLVVAKAYLDQLSRSQALPAKQITDCRRPSKTLRLAHEQG